MNKINIIKFSPYFPPHKWWLETHIEQWSKYYIKKWYWEVFNVTSDIWQIKINFDVIFDTKWNKLWYKNKWYEVLLIPCFDLIYWFPFPKFWKKSFRIVISYLKKKIKEKWENDIFYVHTHTRFFITSFLWWIFAKFNWIKWIHIEHWVDYVKLNSKFKSFLAYIYDIIIWRLVFIFSNNVIAISNWCKVFSSKFTKKEIEVIHRWIEFPLSIIDDKVKEIKISTFKEWKIIIWFIWRLVKLKWVDLLLKVFSKIIDEYENIDFELLVIWDWDEIVNLNKIVNKNHLKEKVKFLWFQKTSIIYSELLPKIHILVNPSFQEWLPTSVIEWLVSYCVVVATDVWGTREISDEKDLILIKHWKENNIYIWITKAIENYTNLIWLSKDTVIKRFDWDISIKKYYTYFKNI